MRSTLLSSKCQLAKGGNPPPIYVDVGETTSSRAVIECAAGRSAL